MSKFKPIWREREHVLGKYQVTVCVSVCWRGWGGWGGWGG